MCIRDSRLSGPDLSGPRLRCPRASAADVAWPARRTLVQPPQPGRPHQNDDSIVSWLRTRPSGGSWDRPSAVPSWRQHMTEDVDRRSGQPAEGCTDGSPTRQTCPHAGEEVLERLAGRELRLETEHLTHPGGVHAPAPCEKAHLVLREVREPRTLGPVSYTHLTLPTILRV